MNDIKLQTIFPVSPARNRPVQRYLTATSVAATMMLAACGDSDLEEIHDNAIVAAQQSQLEASQELQLAAAHAEQVTDQLPETTLSPEPDQTPPTAESPQVETPETPEQTPTETPDVQPEPEQPSEQPAETPVATPAPEQQPEQQTLDLTGYELVFVDNFDGSTVNSAKWNTAYTWGPALIVNNEQQYYVDTQNRPDFGYNPFVFDGEALNITASRTPTDLLSTAADQPFLSGVLTSANKFSFSHGIVEMRAKIPAGAGLWPQFWMLPEEFTGLKPQLFIMEAIGGDTSEIYHSYKWQDASDNLQTSGLLTTSGDDFSADYHTYAVEWSPGELTFYIDGNIVQSFSSENVSSQEMYLIINLAVGGWFPGDADETTPLPATLSIDSVRVYQR